MNTKIFFISLFVLICINPASADQGFIFDSYSHTVELTQKKSIHEIKAAVNGPGGEITMNLPPRTEKLKVFIDDIETSYILEEKKGYALMRCSTPGGTAGKHFISISYETNYPILLLEDRILYTSEYIPTGLTSRFSYLLKLPVGFVIPDAKDVDFFITPKPRNIFSDGQRIILLWEEKNVNSSFEISVLMEPAGGIRTGVPEYLLALLLAGLIGAGYMFYSKKMRPRAITYPALVDHEKVIVDLLKKAEGNVMWQKQIQVQSNFSKVKVSRILQSLEKRGVIRKESWGNTNKIHLVTSSGEVMP